MTPDVAPVATLKVLPPKSPNSKKSPRQANSLETRRSNIPKARTCNYCKQISIETAS